MGDVSEGVADTLEPAKKIYKIILFCIAAEENNCIFGETNLKCGNFQEFMQN
jgi:hypothetical protein